MSTAAFALAGWAFGVIFLVLAVCMVSEWRFNRRVARLTVGQVIALPPRLRVVEDDAPASDPAPVYDLAQFRSDWHGGSAA